MQNSSVASSGIRRASVRASMWRNLFAVDGSRADTSSKLPLVRTDDPNVAAEESFHSSTSCASTFVWCMRIPLNRYSVHRAHRTAS